MNNITLQRVENKTHIVFTEGFNSAPCEDEAFKDNLHRGVYLETGLLPPVVRWLSPSRHYVLLERAPTMQSVVYHAASPYNVDTAKEHIFHIPLPWTLYAIELDDFYYPQAVSVYALPHSIRTGSERLGLLPIPNHYQSGGVCLPPWEMHDLNSVADGIDLAFRLAWHSGFNHDMLHAFKMCARYKQPRELFKDITGRPTPLRIYKAWSKFSPDEVASWEDWHYPHGYGAGVHRMAGSFVYVDKLVALLSMKEAQRHTHEGVVVKIKHAMMT